MHTCRGLLAILLTLCAAASLAQNVNAISPLWSMVHAESTFARTSLEKGMDSAFIAFLSDDAIIFRPHPVNGQEWFRTHPAPPIVLAWAPGFADVAVTGEIGYTTGPWTARDKADTAADPAYGDFVTIWKKIGTSWKVDLDMGISHSAPPGRMQSISPPMSSAPSVLIRPDSSFRQTQWSNLRALEQRAFGDSLHQVRASSLVVLLSPEVRVFRPGFLPVVGSDSAKNYLGSQSASFFRKNIGGDISRGGDLAYTFGSYAKSTDKQPIRGYYLSIWKKEGKGE